MGTVYRVRKSFTAGLLKGLSFTDLSPVPFEVGRSYKSAMTGSEFTVVSCEAVELS